MAPTFKNKDQFQLHKERLFHEEYDIGPLLGRGTFGKVLAAVEKRSRKSFAVKVVTLGSGGDTLAVKNQAACEEEKLWRRIGKHQHCVALRTTFADDLRVYMVMEMCDLSLFSKVGILAEMGDQAVARIFTEMLLGLAHLHALRIVHRDVKPDNYLFGGQARSTVKLCDFGLSASLPEDGKLLPGSCGTPPFMSPEMAGSRGHELSTDIWSFAASAYVLLYSEFLHMPEGLCEDSMRLAVMCGAPAPRFVPAKPGGTHHPSPAAGSFVSALLERKPRRRPAATTALAMPYLSRARSSGRLC